MPSARRSPHTPPRVLGPEDLRRTERIDAMVGGRRPRPRAGRGAGAAGAVRDGQPRGAAAGPLGAGPRRADDGGGQARPLQPPQRLPPGARGRLRPLQARGRRGRPGRRRGAARGQPLERLGRAARRAARALPARRGARRAAPGCRRGSRRRSGGSASRPSWPRDPGAGRRRAEMSTRSRTLRPIGGRSGERVGAAAADSPAAVVAELLSSGESVLALVADATRCAAPGERRRSPWPTTRRWSAEPELAAGFEHVVLVDPPAFAAACERPRVRVARRGGRLPAPGLGRGRAWRFALLALDGAAGPAPRAGRGVQGAARGRRGRRGASCARRFAAAARTRAAPRPRPAASASSPSSVWCRASPSAATGTVGVVSSEGTDLERSAAFRAYSARYEEAQRYLERRRQP